jgi:hypothetical protein
METEMMLSAAAAIAFAALLIVWALAPRQPEPVVVKAPAVAEPTA